MAAFGAASVRQALDDRDVALAFEWLDTIPADRRDPRLCGELFAAASKAAMAVGNGGEALHYARAAHDAVPSAFGQRRVELLRRAAPMLDDRYWEAMAASCPASSLSAEAFLPEIAEVVACGAYHSRGYGQALPWTRYLRTAKQSSDDDEGAREAAFGLAGRFLARYLFERTGLVRAVDLVVPVPANPDRYAARLASLPLELAAAVERHLAIENVERALQWSSSAVDVEMKTLPRGERREAADRAYIAGPAVARVAGREVLVVDDITTSGASLRACAKVLRSAGASQVYAACLAHTEG